MAAAFPLPGMTREGRYLLCYDLSDDRERERVVQVLSGFGRRVQYSVFECRLTQRLKQELLQGLERLGLQSGHVALYKLDSAARRVLVGVPPPEPSAEVQRAWLF